ncbi:MAG: right-handed parallel beta-helix repeat-containing protein, partial [Candidatus Thermoplasmatota archaeon]
MKKCIIAICVILLPLIQLNTEASEIFGDWTIDSSQTITNISEVIILTGNLTVEGTLIFENVTLLMNLTYEGEYGIVVKDGGKLYINNSNISSSNISNHYYFKVENNGTLEMTNSSLSYCGYLTSTKDRYGLYIASDKALIVSNNISYNRDGIYIDSSSPKIMNNSISNNERNGVYLDNSNALVFGNNISSNSGDGIEVYNSRSNIEKNIISDNAYGIYISSATPYISSNEIARNRNDGIYISNSDPKIEGNNISDNLNNGIYATASKINVVNNTINSNDKNGLEIISSDAEIFGNDISSNKGTSSGWGGHGISISSSKTANIEKNSISYNTLFGIYIYGCSPTVFNNTIFKNSNYGIYIGGSSTMPLIDKNEISDNKYINIVVESFSSAKITNNTIKSSKEVVGIYFAESSTSIISNNTITKNRDGIISDKADITVLDNIIISNYNVGLAACGGSLKLLENRIELNVIGFLVAGMTLTLENYTIVNNNYDFYLYDTPFLNRPPVGPALITLINTTFDKATVDPKDKSSQLIVKWFVGIDVFWEKGGAVDGAEIKIFDKNGSEEYKGKVDANGKARLIPVKAYTAIGGVGTIYHSPHKFFASSSKWSNYTFETIDKNKIVTIILDNVPPFLVLTSPKELELFNRTIVDVIGKTEANIDVSANGVLTKSDNYGNFKISVLLVEGLNPINVIATDKAGNPTTVNINVSVDITLPSLSLLSPLNGTYTNLSQIEVRGRAELNSSVIVNGKNTTLDKNGDFTTLVELIEEGENIINVEARDKAGNSVKIIRKVIKDTLEPYLSLFSPSKDTFTNQSTISIIGEVEKYAKITINGQPIAELNGSFITQITLNEGANNIVVEARDKAGNVNRIERIVIYDIKPPKITILSPEEKCVTKINKIVFSGKLDELATLKINDEEVEVIDLEFSKEIELIEGENIIKVYAVDLAGNVATVTRKVILDTIPPDFEVKLENFTNIPKILLEGKGEVGMKVIIDGVAIEVDAEGKFSKQISLNEGKNKVVIIGIDIAGNEKKVGRIVYLDTTPPIITLKWPPENFTTKDDAIEVSG